MLTKKEEWARRDLGAPGGAPAQARPSAPLHGLPAAAPHARAVAAAVPATGPVDSRLRSAWFGVRASGLRLLRGARNLREHVAEKILARRTPVPRISPHPAYSGVPNAIPGAAGGWPLEAGASRTALWNARDPAEWQLTAGKVHNLRVAARRLDGLLIPAGGVFSFWRAVGRPVRSCGFVAGRELREGCLVASTGGGLCQLSNALYAAALQAGLEIVERHAHSKIVPGSLAERGLDATVFWNYLDLRFRAPVDCLLRVELSATHLHVRLLAREAVPRTVPAKSPLTLVAAAAKTRDAQPHHDLPHDCVGCEQTACVEYIAPGTQTGQGAWLLDEVWPEFDQWMQAHARDGDRIMLPLDGRRRKRAAYAWSVNALPNVKVIEHGLLTAARSLNARLLVAQGAARQRGLARMDAAFARSYARGLAPEVDHVTVSLNLLPYLWESGALGGRRFTVLLNRSPLALLHAQLDRARVLHPDSATLGDYRADDALVALEDAALAAAECMVTPHLAVAQYCRARYGEKVQRIEWQAPRAPSQQPAHASTQKRAQESAHEVAQDRMREPAPEPAREPAREWAKRGGAVLFPASALGRKGAYEVREACRALNLPVRVLGSANEGAGFWEGVNAEPADARDPWAGVGCVVLPAFVEHRPRLLLAARARGLAVVCSEDCGLPEDAQGGVHMVRAGHVIEVTEALARAAA